MYGNKELTITFNNVWVTLIHSSQTYNVLGVGEIFGRVNKQLLAISFYRWGNRKIKLFAQNPERALITELRGLQAYTIMPRSLAFKTINVTCSILEQDAFTWLLTESFKDGQPKPWRTPECPEAGLCREGQSNPSKAFS